MVPFIRRALLAGIALTGLPAHGADILDARYNAASDQIEALIAYRGTNPDHEFAVQWGACSDGSPQRTVGRLVDRQGGDTARENFRTTAKISLRGIPCRPAIVTLRLGRTAHTDVYVPIDEAPVRR